MVVEHNALLQVAMALKNSRHGISRPFSAFKFFSGIDRFLDSG
jgi:hypothetical protein